MTAEDDEQRAALLRLARSEARGRPRPVETTLRPDYLNDDEVTCARRRRELVKAWAEREREVG
jgi:hypothetical protein